MNVYWSVFYTEPFIPRNFTVCKKGIRNAFRKLSLLETRGGVYVSGIRITSVQNYYSTVWTYKGSGESTVPTSTQGETKESPSTTVIV